MITLTTDFGTSDAYVASMKGAMLSIHPDARFVDVTHDISPQDVMEAAFVLRTALSHFPPNTVHLVVVDPGVGTDRRAVAIRHGDRTYVGPDNGLFSLVLDEAAPDAIVELDDPSVWHTDTPSTTFHGRDIFAPVAAHLDAGRSLDEVGSPVDDLTPLRWALPITDANTVQGWVVHVDRFGNCITNIRRSTIQDAIDRREDDSRPPMKGYAGSAVVEGIHDTYGAVPGGDPLMLFGSTGFLELAVNAGDASELLDIRKGDSVKIVFQRAGSDALFAEPAE